MNMKVFWAVFLSIALGAGALVAACIAVAYVFEVFGLLLGCVAVIVIVALAVALFAGFAERNSR